MLKKTLAIVMFLYVVMSYLSFADYILPVWHSVILYLFLVLSFLFLIYNKSDRKYLFPQLRNYIFIFVLCIVSSFWSLDTYFTLDESVEIFKIILVSLSFLFYIEGKKDLDFIFLNFVLGGIFLIFGFIIDGKWVISDERLGVGEFGYYNIIAMAFLISSLCSVYLLSITRNSYLSILLIIAYVLFEITLFLIQGRKYIIFSLLMMLFLLIRIIFKNPRKILVLSFFILVIFFLFDKINNFYTNINFFEDSRLVKSINFNEQLSEDLLRLQMIETGIDWFLNKPFLGYGHRCYELMFEKLHGRRSYSHNNFIEILVNLGLLGFFVYYINYIKLIFEYGKNYLRSELGFFIFYLLFSFFILDLVVVSYYSQLVVQVFILTSGYVLYNKEIFLKE